MSFTSVNKFLHNINYAGFVWCHYHVQNINLYNSYSIDAISKKFLPDEGPFGQSSDEIGS